MKKDNTHLKNFVRRKMGQSYYVGVLVGMVFSAIAAFIFLVKH